MNGKDFSKLKEDLIDALVSTICPIGKKIKELRSDEGSLIKILNNGSNKAKVIADENLRNIKKIVGFI